MKQIKQSTPHLSLSLYPIQFSTVLYRCGCTHDVIDVIMYDAACFIKESKQLKFVGYIYIYKMSSGVDDDKKEIGGDDVEIVFDIK